jgi:transcriptional regulator with XRE-family HTH domain
MATDSEPPVSPEQSRAARALLDWSQTKLAKMADLSESTVRNFERGERKKSTRPASPDAVDAVRKALEAAGVEFIPGNGKGPGVRIAEGAGGKPKAPDRRKVRAK